MNPLLINHFIGFSLIAVILPLIAALVYFNRPHNVLNQTFSAYLMAIAWWAFFTIFMIFSPSYSWGLFWDRVCLSGVVFIPSTLFHFVSSYTKDHQRFKNVIKANYSVSLIFLIILWSSNLFVAAVKPKFGMNFFTVPGAAYLFFVLFFIINVILALVNLWRFSNLKIQNSKVKKQSSLLFWFSVIGYTGGSCNYLLVYDIDFHGLAETSNYGVLILSLSIAYIIFRYRFLDVEVIVRRTVVFAGLLTFVFAVFGASAFLVREALSHYLHVSSVWTYGISLFLIVLAFDPIRNMLVNLTDHYLFQKKYNYQKILKDASRGMAKIESLQHLLELVVHFITMRMRVKSTSVLTRKEGVQFFELGFQRGYQRNFLEYHVSETDPLMQYLMLEREALDIERVKEYIEAGNIKKLKNGEVRTFDFPAIRQQMEELEAVCCVPSYLGRELRNVLVLGDKKSGDYYSDEDINVLFTLAQESAIAIENARLYDEAINKTHQLEKINEQLEYSKNLLMKALSETEVANKQLQDTQAQLIHEQKMATLGRLAASVGHEVNNPLTILSMNVSRAILKYRKNPDLKVGDIVELFQKMEQNIGRIKAVVNTLTGLLKKSEKGKFEPLSLKLILEETLPLVQFQTYLDNLTGTDVEFDIPGSIPLIRGDLERLQEVFLNLFINAYHAMAGKRNRKIRVSAEVNPANAHEVAIHFKDNGSGMTEDVMRKIFNYGFTTKPPGRGSGMGLYMCKYILELHGGDVKVASKLGEGTTFTLTLPIYEEAGSSTGLSGTGDLPPAEAMS